MSENITISINNIIYPVLILQGEEKLFSPYYFELTLQIEDLLTFSYFLKQPALLKITDNYNRERKIAGIIIKIIQEDAGVTIRFASRISLLKYQKRPKTFVNQSVETIITFILTQVGYHSLQIRWQQMNPQILPFRIQMPDQTDFDFLHQLLAEQKIYYFIHCELEIEIIYFIKKPLSLFKREDSLLLIYLQNSVTQYNCLFHTCLSISKKNIISGKTSCPDIFTGMIIYINIGAIHDQVHKSLQHYQEVLSIRHQLKKHVYQQTITFRALDQSAALPSKKTKYLVPTTLSGTAQTINEAGNYETCYDFEKAISENTLYYALPRLMPYAGNNIGWHSPFTKNTYLLIGYKTNNPNDPFIFGVFSHQQYKGPVNNSNPTQHILKTKNQHEFCMEDTQHNQYISVTTKNKSNQLYMSNTQKKIHIVSMEGKLYIESKENITQTAHKNLTENYEDNYFIKIHKDYHLQVNGNINYTSGQNYFLATKKNITISSNKNINITSGKNINIQSNKIIIQTKVGDLKIKAIKGSIKLNGSQIIIQSASNIHLSTQNAGILLTADGTITLYGESITGLQPSNLINYHEEPRGFPE